MWKNPILSLDAVLAVLAKILWKWSLNNEQRQINAKFMNMHAKMLRSKRVCVCVCVLLFLLATWNKLAEWF